jgi:hypothetical protein
MYGDEQQTIHYQTGTDCAYGQGTSLQCCIYCSVDLTTYLRKGTPDYSHSSGSSKALSNAACRPQTNFSQKGRD